jgi:hypothetical protein
MEIIASKKMTDEELQARADELSVVHSVKVIPMAFEEEGNSERIVGFIKEPNRITKLRMMDKSVMGAFTAAAEILEACLIREESDPRIFSEKAEHDKIYMGAVMACYDTVKYSVSTFKKK